MPANPALPRRRQSWRKRAAKALAFGVRLRRDEDLRRRHVTLSADDLGELSRALIEKYFKADEAYLATEEGNQDFYDHLLDRLVDNRRRVIPWLNRIRPLNGTRILEIGSGTGSSTVAFSEQGARVSGIDIDSPSLDVAHRRCELYGQGGVELVQANIVGEHPVFRQRYDLIVFFASLEHMLHDERLEGLRRAWAMLDTGGLLAVVECPNRLWFIDEHTAWLPFFHWLPDQLAAEYVRFSPRVSLRRDEGAAGLESFLRYGRGVSFHEFDLALGTVERTMVAGELESHLHRFYPAFYVRHRFSLAHPYERLLRKIAPEVHPGFLRSVLNIVLRKP